jgi:Tfp pilus assembly protein PilO
MQMFAKLDHKVIDLTGMLVTGALALLVGAVFVGGSLQAIGGLTDEQRELTGQLGHLTELASTLGQGEEVLGALQEGLDEIDRRLPDSMDFEQFYTDLSRFATENQVAISGMQPGVILKEETYVEMPITLTATAAFEDFHQFFFALSNLTRLTKVDSLSLNGLEDTGMCAIDVTLRIYAAAQSEEGGHGE